MRLRRSAASTAIGVRTAALAAHLSDELARLRHENGTPVVTLYQADDARRRSSIVAFNVRRADGSAVGFAEVATLARLVGLQLRTGCFCNVGACAFYLGWREPHLAAMERAQRTCGDDNDVLFATADDGTPLEVQTGAVRVSFGSQSLPSDAERVLDLVRRFFVDAALSFATPQRRHYVGGGHHCRVVDLSDQELRRRARARARAAAAARRTQV
jgi:molybdenum cofactor sulfurtransferase